jgi:protein O-mannosyl-transferase
LSLTYEPDNSDILSKLQWSYYHIDQYEKSKKLIEIMMELDPTDLGLYVRLTDNYVLLRQSDTCIDNVEPMMYEWAEKKIMKRDDKMDLSYIYLNVAVCYSKKQNFRKAEEINRQALEIYDSAHGHNNLGVSLAEQGRKIEAIREYKKAINIDPNYMGAKKNLNYLDK